MESILEQLVQEIREHPERAKDFFDTLRMTVGPWESLTSENAMVSSGFSRSTVFGEVVASITIGYPKWNILIEGNVPKESIPVFHRTTAEQEAKALVDNLLKEKNYIVID